ncbi:MAG: hypothetical protein J5857_02470 [Treponema sp.]|nr:hypothetical protein [Treponema sp.]
MKETNIDVKRLNTIANKFLLLAFASVMFYLSIIFRSRGGAIRLSIFNYFNTIAYSIFAILHALHLFLFMRQKGKNTGIIDFITYVILFLAFYSVVLLPASGFALAEWLVVTLCLFPGLISSVTPIRENGKLYRMMPQNPVWFMAIGILLMLFKVILWWAAPDNLYLSAVTGNQTLRMALVVLCGAGIAVLVNQWISRHKISQENKSKVSKAVQKGVGAVSSILSTVWSFALTIFTGPVLLIIICIAILVFIICSVIFAQGVISDIQDIIEPILDKLLTTGQDSIIKSKLYTICQVSSFVGCTLFQIILFLTAGSDHQETDEGNKTPVDEKKKTSIKEKSRKRIEEVRTPEIIHLGASDRMRNS